MNALDASEFMPHDGMSLRTAGPDETIARRRGFEPVTWVDWHRFSARFETSPSTCWHGGSTVCAKTGSRKPFRRYRLTRELLPHPQGGRVCCEHGSGCGPRGESHRG